MLSKLKIPIAQVMIVNSKQMYVLIMLLCLATKLRCKIGKKLNLDADDFLGS